MDLVPRMTTKPDTRTVRVALLTNASGQGFTASTATAYLPANYEAVEIMGADTFVIYGYDNHGWTLDGYVLPRLASGLYFARELT